MGLLDSIAGQVLGSMINTNSGAGAHPGWADVIGSLVNNPQTGGLPGLINSFQQGGLGNVVASWVGTGQNLPISPDQITSVLGSGQIAEIAQKLGLSPQDVSGHLAQVLPQVVDHVTPGGELPDGDAIGSLLGMLKGAA